MKMLCSEDWENGGKLGKGRKNKKNKNLRGHFFVASTLFVSAHFKNFTIKGALHQFLHVKVS